MTPRRLDRFPSEAEAPASVVPVVDAARWLDVSARQVFHWLDAGRLDGCIIDQHCRVYADSLARIAPPAPPAG